MPEGDTIHRAASGLRRWIVGREVTAACSSLPSVDASSLVGSTCASVDVHGKHLMMRFSGIGPDRVLHTHMRMTGSWHVYSTGESWQRPQRQARVVIECGARLAVCFNAPVVELTTDADCRTAHREAVGHLGPDILVAPPDLDEMVRRARCRPVTTALGELLLDQRVAAGIGNVYRCESLFLEGHNPWRSLGSVDGVAVAALFGRAAALMRVGVDGTGALRDVGRGAGQAWVYGRAGRPCHLCASSIRSRPQGAQARTVFWCPTCQAGPIR